MDNNRYSIEFLYYCIKVSKNELTKNRQDANIPSLSKKDVQNFIVNYPTLKEQEKIAECLSSVDNLIGKKQTEIESLKKYKDGLLQQLFPQGDNNLPILRFSEFNENWDKSTIGILCEVKTGSKDTQNKTDDGKYPFFVRSNNVEKIDSYSYDGEAILTAGDGVGVGKVFHYIKGKFDYHQRVYNIYGFKNCHGKYIYYYFSNNFYGHVSRLNAKNSVDSVRRNMITDMPVPIPPQSEEQKKIADCLTSLDNLINLKQQELDKLSRYKKGLLQQLLVQG